MRLWTIQTIEVWESIQKQGYHHGREDRVYEDNLPAYRWLAEQMRKRIGEPPIENIYPVWGWYKPKPDLRSSCRLPPKTRGVRLEIEIPDNEVLLSDFELWHFALNYWYLPDSDEDDERFELRTHEHGLSIYSVNPLPSPFHEEVLQSWERIFDIDWVDENKSIAHDPDDKWLQATFWALNIGQVIKVKEFVSR